MLEYSSLKGVYLVFDFKAECLSGIAFGDMEVTHRRWKWSTRPQLLGLYAFCKGCERGRCVLFLFEPSIKGMGCWSAMWEKFGGLLQGPLTYVT